MSELKACPCGRIVPFVTVTNFNGAYFGGCVCGWNGPEGTTEDEAIELWNRRTEPNNLPMWGCAICGETDACERCEDPAIPNEPVLCDSCFEKLRTKPNEALTELSEEDLTALPFNTPVWFESVIDTVEGWVDGYYLVDDEAQTLYHLYMGASECLHSMSFYQATYFGTVYRHKPEGSEGAG